MNIKQITTTLCIFFLFACEKEDVVDFDGPWNKNEAGQVILYTRPQNYSSSASLGEEQIQLTLKNQNDFIAIINRELGLNFTQKCTIYLYNYDEALEKIGTNGGGRTLTNSLTICYAYHENVIYYPNWKVSDYMGLHEMVHIVSISQLGKGGTRLMTEGYAVAIDGSYSGYKDKDGKITRSLLAEWMAAYAKASKVYRPTELLKNPDDYPEEVFYPQSGFFVSWLFDKYGVAKINQIFTSSGKDLKTDFYKVIGIRFEEMETEYMSQFKL